MLFAHLVDGGSLQAYNTQMLEVILIVIIVLCGLSITWFTLRTGISPMPSSTKACRTILKASEQAGRGTIIDLGSGWGTLLFALARKYPERPVIGYELSWLPWIYSQICKTIFGLHNVKTLRQNFLTADLSEAALLVCYLFPRGMSELQQKLSHGQHPDTLLISSTFALPDNQPSQTIRLDDLYSTPIYIYGKSSGLNRGQKDQS